MEPGQFPLGPEDVLVVSGGGKGIGAECANEAARASGAKLALMGSSAIGHPELAASLRRMQSSGLRVEYFRADVTEAVAVRSACDGVRRALGPITAILHCAGINRPQSIYRRSAYRRSEAKPRRSQLA
jgi:enediyne polyketide synthase